MLYSSIKIYFYHGFAPLDVFAFWYMYEFVSVHITLYIRRNKILNYVNPAVDRCSARNSCISSSLTFSSPVLVILFSKKRINILSEFFQFGFFSVFSDKTNLFMRFILAEVNSVDRTSPETSEYTDETAKSSTCNILPKTF